MSTRNSAMPPSTAVPGIAVTPAMGRGLEFLGVPDPRLSRVRQESAEFLTRAMIQTKLKPFTTAAEIAGPGLFPVPGMYGALRRWESSVDPFRRTLKSLSLISQRYPLSMATQYAGPAFIPVPGIAAAARWAEWNR